MRRLTVVTALLVFVTLAVAAGAVAKTTVGHASGWDSVDIRQFSGGEFNVDSSQTQVPIAETQLTVTVPAGKRVLLRVNIASVVDELQGAFRVPCPSGSVMEAFLVPTGPFANGHVVTDFANNVELVVNADRVVGPGNYTFGVAVNVQDASSCPSGTAMFNLPPLSVTVERATLQ